MADIPNRDELERQLARALAKLFKQFSGHLLELLEEYDYNLDMLPPGFWSGLTREEIAVLLPFLEKLAQTSAELLMTEIPIGISWELVNEAAANWARVYAGELVRGIDQTSRGMIATQIRNAIAAFFEEGLTRGELVQRLQDDPALMRLFTRDIRDRLGRIYGPYRAEMIAVTEVTRAASEGQLAAITQLNREGVAMEAVWHTRNDELVCPLCGPLNEKRADWYDSDRRPYWGDVSVPPRHPRCRCSHGWTLPEVPNA